MTGRSTIMIRLKERKEQECWDTRTGCKMVAATALMKYEKLVDSAGGVGGGSKPRMTCE